MAGKERGEVGHPGPGAGLAPAQWPVHEAAGSLQGPARTWGQHRAPVPAQNSRASAGTRPADSGTCIAGFALALTAPRGAGTTRRGTPVIPPLGRDLNAVPRSPERVPSPPPTFLLRSTSSRHGCQGLVAASQTVGTQGPRIKPIEFFLPGFATSPAMLTIPSLLGDMCIACLWTGGHAMSPIFLTDVPRGSADTFQEQMLIIITV